MGAHHPEQVLARLVGARMGADTMTALQDAFAELDAEIEYVAHLREQDQAAATDAVRSRTAALRDARQVAPPLSDVIAGQTPSTGAELVEADLAGVEGLDPAAPVVEDAPSTALLPVPTAAPGEPVAADSGQ